MSKRTRYEMIRGDSLLDVITMPDGTLRACNVYRKGRDLNFNNPAHLFAFSKKYNYTVVRVRNS